MNNTGFIGRKIVATSVVVLCSFCISAWGQSADGSDVKPHRHSVYLGVGPNYYFNNLILGKDQVNVVNYSFVGRYMWEPEHLLTIGFELGYYRLYSLQSDRLKHTSIRNSAVPFQLTIGMRFLKKKGYFNFGIGRSLLINDITTNADGDFDATTFSLADFTTTLGYRKQINTRFSLSSELKLYYASKAADMNLALAFVAGYSFK